MTLPSALFLPWLPPRVIWYHSLPFLSNAQNADVADVVVAAGIHATRNVEADVAQVVKVIQVLETCLNGLGNRDRFGIGQCAEVAAGASDDVGQQTDVGATQPLLAGQAPQRMEIRLGHIRQHDILFMGDADFTETELLGPFGHGLHLLGRHIPGGEAIPGFVDSTTLV